MYLPYPPPWIHFWLSILEQKNFQGSWENFRTWVFKLEVFPRIWRFKNPCLNVFSNDRIFSKGWKFRKPIWNFSGIHFVTPDRRTWLGNFLCKEIREPIFRNLAELSSSSKPRISLTKVTVGKIDSIFSNFDTWSLPIPGFYHFWSVERRNSFTFDFLIIFLNIESSLRSMVTGGIFLNCTPHYVKTSILSIFLSMFDLS